MATANDLVRLNGGELVRIVCGAEDRLQLGTGFSLVSSSAEGSRFIPRFVSGNASIEVVHDPMWSNPFDNADVNGDGLVAPQDALAVINVLNSGRVSMPNSQFLSPSQLSSDQFRFYDVNGDNQLTPADALVVINRLNRVTSAREPTQSVWIDVESPNGRRRRSGDLPSEIVDELFDIEGGSF